MDTRKLLINVPLMIGTIISFIIIIMNFSPLFITEQPIPQNSEQTVPSTTTSSELMTYIQTTTPTITVDPLTLSLEERIDLLVPKQVLKYEIQYLNGSILREQVDAGKTINLTINGNLLEIELTLNDMYSPEYKSQLPPEQQVISTYKGRVIGENDSSVRLSLRKNVVRGSVRIGYKKWYFEPLKNYGDLTAFDIPINTHFIYDLWDVNMSIDLSNDVITQDPPIC